MSSNFDLANRPQPDQVLTNIADYVINYQVTSNEALTTARNCLIDTIACGLMALKFKECTKLLGPLVANTTVANGARVFGTNFKLDPVKAAWDIGCIVRWLDFNDTWLAAEWGHPSDNLGAIIALADYISRVNVAKGEPSLTMKDVLHLMVKAHEIQGVFALENSFNRVGLDHVLLVRIASTAVATYMLGGNLEQITNALSQAFVDGSSLRTYRHAPNAGSRKSWAAGDATSRAVRLALIAMTGEMGMPSVLSAKTWGFYDVCFKGKEFKFTQNFGSYVMENILFKISYPAEFHAQTAVECACILHKSVKAKLDKIDRIELITHESAIRIISKGGELDIPADRDHCLQYMVAVALLEGTLEAEHYEDNYHHANPMIDQLRQKMTVTEDLKFSQDYLASDKRSIANSIQIFFKNGKKTDKVTVEYPLGHRRRRAEGIPILEKKFAQSLAGSFNQEKCTKILDICLDQQKLENTTVVDFMDLLTN